MEAIPAPGLGSGERVGNRPGGRAVSLFLWCSGPQIPSFLTQEGYPQLQLHPSSSVRMEMTGTAVACCCCCHSPGGLEHMLPGCRGPPATCPPHLSHNCPNTQRWEPRHLISGAPLCPGFPSSFSINWDAVSGYLPIPRASDSPEKGGRLPGPSVL